jgi:hypothetical protein
MCSRVSLLVCEVGFVREDFAVCGMIKYECAVKKFLEGKKRILSWDRKLVELRHLVEVSTTLLRDLI